MDENTHHSYPDIFTYHYFSPKKDIQIRYGLTKDFGRSDKPIFILLHGRAEFIEKYKCIAVHLQKKGFHIVSFDWRGQGLSSREVLNTHKGHIDTFDDYIEDLERFYAAIIQPYNLPVNILAHSMGGHIGLRFISRHPDKIRKAVLASPMIDIAIPTIVKPISKLLSNRVSRTFFSKSYAAGTGNYSAKKAKFKGNRLCHDPEKYWILHEEIANNPDLAIGGVTWAWLNAAFESIKELNRLETIQKISTPILMLSAQKDTVVSSRAQKKLSEKLPNCKFLSIKGAFHELLFEENRIHNQLWDAFDRFIFESSLNEESSL